MAVPERRLCLLLLLLAAFNPVLRPSVDIPVTPYYLAAPVLFGWLLMVQPRFRRWAEWLAVGSSYGLAVGLVYGTPLPMQLAQLLKYLQLLAFFGLLERLCNLDAGSVRRLERVVYGLVAAVCMLAVVQQLTGFEIPTVVNEESSVWLNTFFFTPNDLALFLCGALCLLLASDASWVLKIAVLLALSALNLRNDAKAALLATFLILGMQALLWASSKMRLSPMAGILLFLVGLPVAVVALSGVVIEAGESEFDFLQLFIDPIEHITSLQPYGLGGSIFDRTDALIYSLQAIRSMHWLGLGPAGSVYTLSLPNFELLTAKSLHNALAELLVEMGPAMLLLLFVLLRPVVASMFRTRLTSGERGRLMLLAAAPMLSVSQSAGYISNYAFWLVAYVVWRSGRPAPRA